VNGQVCSIIHDYQITHVNVVVSLGNDKIMASKLIKKQMNVKVKAAITQRKRK
jgi:hypothetical protein